MNNKEIIIIDAQEVILETLGEIPQHGITNENILSDGIISEIIISPKQIKDIEYRDWRDRANGLSV